MLKEVKKYYPNGSINEHYYIDEHRNLQGEYKSWHENGQLKMQYFFVDDKRNGELKIWHFNGQLEKYCTYKDDLMHGEYKLFYEHGQLRIHCHNRKGSLHGEYKSWNKNGQLEYHSYLLNGVSITPQVITLIEDINNITEEERLLIMLKFGIPLLPAGETLC